MSKTKALFMPVAAILALSAVLPLAAPLTAQDTKPKTTSPRVLYRVDPQYTEEAKTAKVSGSVLLKVTVDENGNAQNIQVAKSLDEGLDQKAIEAVRQWRFAPGTEDGKPVAVAANIEVNFRLQ
jgi:TonB family protein